MQGVSHAQTSNVHSKLFTTNHDNGIAGPSEVQQLTTEPSIAAAHVTTVNNVDLNLTKAHEARQSYAPTQLDSCNALSPANVTGMIQALADTASATRALVVTQTQTRKPQHIDLPHFTGDPLQWLPFKRAFDISKEFFSPLENVTRLQNVLRGAAREAVASLLLSAEAPDVILQLLEHNFARPEVIVLHEVASLKSLPIVTLDLKGLPTFASRIRNSVATMRLLNQTEYLHSPELFYTIIGKLNHTLRIRWTDYASENKLNKTKLELLSDFLLRELERHVMFGLSPDSMQSTSFSKAHLSKQSGHHNISVHALGENKIKAVCIYCNQSHNIRDCSDFKQLLVEDKWRWLRSKKVCYRCLKGNAHTWNTCKAKVCGFQGCTRRHHVLLHGDSAASSSSQPQIEEVVSLSTTNPKVYSSRSSATLLKVVPVTVSGPAGSYDTFALLDDGSTATLINAEVAKIIGVAGPTQTIKISGIGGMTQNTNIAYVTFDIKGKYTQDTFTIKNARAIDSLSLHEQTIEKSDVLKYDHLSPIVDMITFSNAVPTILIGAEDWFLSLTREIRRGARSEPVACFTVLGWTLYGSVNSRTKPVEFINLTSCQDNDEDKVESLENLIKEQYKLDSIGITKRDSSYNSDDQRALTILSSTSKRLPSGRFIVGLPWRNVNASVPDSYYQAESRLKGLEKRMAKDNVFAVSYRNYMAEMVAKGYAEECAVDTYHTQTTFNSLVDVPTASTRWYLPHFGVYHPQKKKLRVVHDAAAKTQGVSLNTLLLTGPDLLQSLVGILLRFREGRYALTADIKEMFPQVRIRPEDRDALRYLWRLDPKEPIKEYRMTSVIFGACSSPFTALYVKNKNAKELSDLYPAAADAVVHDHYMDDYIGSLDDLEEAARLAADIVRVHKAACFEMRGWIANDDRVLKLVPADLRAAPITEVSLGNPVRALGVIWDPKEDCLGFRSTLTEKLLSSDTLTKRTALSELMRIYDPLGFLAPIIVKGRILFQSLWRSNVGWDDQLPKEEALVWRKWFSELATISHIRIPRCYQVSQIFKSELHLFADASELAYACVAYWRFTLTDGRIKLALIASKSRVTPLKPVSIPRLELQAALIAARLSATILDSHRKQPTRTVYWSDSRTVLSWLRADARTFRPFVAHRVGEISEITNIADWRWVPTDLNVADDATRIRSFESSSRWFSGPPFLLHPEELRPTEPTATIAPILTELKTTSTWEMVGLTLTRDLLPIPVTADPARFSDWIRLLRATARAHQAALKFKQINLQNSRRNPSNSSSNCNPSSSVSRRLGSQLPTTVTNLPALATNDIESAERHILRLSQLESFEEDIRCILASQSLSKSSKLEKLSPTLGEDNLLRLAGRIKATPHVSADVRTPILLDGRHAIVRLLVFYFHKRMGHANNETVVNEIRQKYWILRLRPIVRNVAKSCLFCRIRKALPLSPPTADLPAERLAHHTRPFTHVGLDYFGPLEVTIGRRREKRYVALYTCLTVRALHLEIVHSLSTDSAIMSLRRFIARRGSPATITSDNGTAFVGANKELKLFFGNDVQDFVATRGIKWNFIPPAAPFFGGCWERLVRSTKTVLRVTLHQKAPKEETLLTLLLEAEAIVNSRPLTHVGVDAEDEEALTPFHFLIGQSSSITIPSPALTDSALIGRSEWRKASRLADIFWTRWVREALPLLHLRPPACKAPSSVRVGDVVVIADSNLPRGVWPKGRVTKLYPGRDGTVRVVDVATKGGILRRPLKKIVNITF